MSSFPIFLNSSNVIVDRLGKESSWLRLFRDRVNVAINSGINTVRTARTPYSCTIPFVKTFSLRGVLVSLLLGKMRSLWLDL